MFPTLFSVVLEEEVHAVKHSCESAPIHGIQQSIHFSGLLPQAGPTFWSKYGFSSKARYHKYPPGEIQWNQDFTCQMAVPSIFFMPNVGPLQVPRSDTPDAQPPCRRRLAAWKIWKWPVACLEAQMWCDVSYNLRCTKSLSYRILYCRTYPQKVRRNMMFAVCLGWILDTRIFSPNIKVFPVFSCRICWKS